MQYGDKQIKNLLINIQKRKSKNILDKILKATRISVFDKKQNEFVLGFGAEHQQAVSRVNFQKDIPMHCLLLLLRRMMIYSI